MRAGDDEQTDIDPVTRQIVERLGGSCERPEPDMEERVCAAAKRAKAALRGTEFYEERASTHADDQERASTPAAELFASMDVFPRLVPGAAEWLIRDPHAGIARAIVDEQERRAFDRAELAVPTDRAAIVALGDAIAAALLDRWQAPDLEQLVDTLADRLGVDRLMTFMQALADRIGEPPEPRGNAVFLARQRAQTLGACVAVMARYPDETRYASSGRFAASRIAGRAVSHHRELWGRDGPGQDADCAPLEEEGIARLVSRYLKHLTQT